MAVSLELKTSHHIPRFSLSTDKNLSEALVKRIANFALKIHLGEEALKLGPIYPHVNEIPLETRRIQLWNHIKDYPLTLDKIAIVGFCLLKSTWIEIGEPEPIDGLTEFFCEKTIEKTSGEYLDLMVNELESMHSPLANLIKENEGLLQDIRNGNVKVELPVLVISKMAIDSFSRYTRYLKDQEKCRCCFRCTLI